MATTIATHAELARLALEFGKHVLLQKPMATTLPDAEAVLAAADCAGVILQCEPPHVLHPYAVQARADVESGLIGRSQRSLPTTAHQRRNSRRLS
ncbi:MAG: Gfo/Idh/MocA family oxidoreductase [Chloroflexi bacterium]|nr:Gfo/Idh/MocA family oxidoreductase [Chloroflexota bacterium]